MNTHTCSPLATCHNTPDSYYCTCLPGYTGDGFTCSGTLGYCDNLYIEVDECAMNTHTCSPLAICHNTPDSYYCTCPPGYTGDGFTCSGSTPGHHDYCNYIVIVAYFRTRKCFCIIQAQTEARESAIHTKKYSCSGYYRFLSNGLAFQNKALLTYSLFLSAFTRRMELEFYKSFSMTT